MCNTTRQHTAILIFALSPCEEQKRKKILKGDTLFHALSKQTIKTVRKTGLTYFHLTENEQKGDSFGARFSNAIQSIYDKGFEQIITIGNDSPQLKAFHILKAAKLLAKNQIVLGPSNDGGFYLMGLHKKNFNKNVFRNLPWQTSRLGNQLKLELSTTDSVIVQLDRLYDIDNALDLKILSKFSKELSPLIIRLIQSLINTNKTFFETCSLKRTLFHSSIYQNKGSPILQLL